MWVSVRAAYLLRPSARRRSGRGHAAPPHSCRRVLFSSAWLDWRVSPQGRPRGRRAAVARYPRGQTRLLSGEADLAGPRRSSLRSKVCWPPGAEARVDGGSAPHPGRGWGPSRHTPPGETPRSLPRRFWTGESPRSPRSLGPRHLARPHRTTSAVKSRQNAWRSPGGVAVNDQLVEVELRNIASGTGTAGPANRDYDAGTARSPPRSIPRSPWPFPPGRIGPDPGPDV